MSWRDTARFFGAARTGPEPVSSTPRSALSRALQTPDRGAWEPGPEGKLDEVQALDYVGRVRHAGRRGSGCTDRPAVADRRAGPPGSAAAGGAPGGRPGRRGGRIHQHV